MEVIKFEDGIESDLKYKKLYKIGQGGYGEIYKCLSYVDNKFYVMKIINLSKQPIANGKPDKNLIEPKIYTILKCECPNIICAKKIFKYDGKLYIIFDFIDNARDFKNFSDEYENGEATNNTYYLNIFKALKDIASAIKYIHDKNILHLDIKPENMMITHYDGYKCEDIKGYLIDFGLSCLLDSEDNDLKCQKSYRGTPFFSAPEILFKATSEKYIQRFINCPILYEKLKDVDINKYTDIFEFGMTILSLIYTKIDFNSLSYILKMHEMGIENYIEKYNSKVLNTFTINTGESEYKLKYNFPIYSKEDINILIKDLLIGMLNTNVEQRINIDQVIILINDIYNKLDEYISDNISKSSSKSYNSSCYISSHNSSYQGSY